MTTNPYLTRPGFRLRYNRAKAALEAFGQDELSRPYSRDFDNCFEMFDGDAVVWALMHDAMVNYNIDLAEGIRRLGENAWSQWLEVHEQRGKYAPRYEQLGLFTQTTTRRTKPKSPTML